MLEYLFIAFIVIFCIQFFYNFFLFSFFSFSKQKTIETSFTEPVSVIICAKNEAQNLIENIPYFLKQNYPNFQLVLINDNSHDETLDVIEQFKLEFPNQIKIVDVAENEQFWGSKKYALTLGIKAASYEHLLFTDADCKPVSDNWIAEMVSHFTSKKQLILGYSPYKKIKKSLLNKLLRYETLLTAIQYFSYAKFGLPYMGVGRNIAYTKSEFFAAKGFSKHMHVKSGDDDLFVNQIATKKNTSFCTSKNSFIESIPKLTLKDWIAQKRRHISTASHYKTIHQFLLGMYFVSKVSFWIIGLLLISFQFQWQIIAGLLLFKIILFYAVIWSSAKKLNEKDLILIAPFLELFLIFIQMIIFIKNLFSKPLHW
ncbi:glycosyltransferase [Lutibacter sp. HS1-25]|uniref:glycosyltransferase n=1 Tax=Lutibacter sp. HS1-25 TaxID=2485000 RepID=UPI001011FD98|nr:glycosyltransferase [Lutibacter sp. HS1-25]RXP57660.1 glycosyltransferase [Lutibacter sp. HS1-25]